MIDVIKALIPIINTALMCVILNLINARKSRRIRQFPLVVFFVYINDYRHTCHN